MLTPRFELNQVVTICDRSSNRNDQSGVVVTIDYGSLNRMYTLIRVKFDDEDLNWFRVDQLI